MEKTSKYSHPCIMSVLYAFDQRRPRFRVIGVHRTACFRGDADVFPDEEGGIRPNVLCGTGITGGAGIDRLAPAPEKISKCRAPNLVERFHRAIFFAQELNQPFAAAGGRRVVQHLIGNGQILHKIEFRFIAQEIPDEPRIVLPRFELLRVCLRTRRILFGKHIRKITEHERIRHREIRQLAHISHAAFSVIYMKLRKIACEFSPCPFRTLQAICAQRSTQSSPYTRFRLRPM